MPSPTSAINRFDLSMTTSELDFTIAQMGFIGTRVFRPRSVAKQSGSAGKLELKTYLKNSAESNQRAPKSGYKRDDFDFTTWSYDCKEYGRESPVDDAEVALYGDIIEVEKLAAGRAVNSVVTEFEEKVAAKIFDPVTWTGASLFLNVTDEWDDETNADIEADIDTAREAIVQNSGLDANALIVNRFVYRNMCRSERLRDILKYTTRPTAQQVRQALAELLDLDFILVAGGIHNSNNPGQDAAISRIWSNEYAMVCRIATSDDLMEPCVGRTFMWDGDGPGAAGSDEKIAVIMEEYREESIRGGVMRARTHYDENRMYVEAGFLLGNVTT